MIDTLKLSKTFARPPNTSELIRKGWKTLRYDDESGESISLCFNSPKGECKPRLSLALNRNNLWNIHAEVALGSWLHGSNLHLPNEDELHHGLDLLSEYVESKSDIVFDAHTERVTRVDFTHDFYVSEDAVIPIIAKFKKFELSRYEHVCYNDTSVYFNNSLDKGKLTKQFKIYSKYHERLDTGKDKVEQEAAKGLIRLEISYRKSAVYRLAKSLKLPSHHANHILTKVTSEKVIQKAMKQLHFDGLLTAECFSVEKLFEQFGATMPFSLIGFLWLKDKCGEDLTKLSFINTSPKTLKRYSDNCSKAGVISLE